MCGVGVKDIKIGKQEFIDKTLLSRQYYLWKGMLTRCYSGNKKYKWYHDCKVCQRWHTFSNFVADLPKLPNYDLWVANVGNGKVCLDKDILGGYHRCYSPNYCMFVTLKENSEDRIKKYGAPKLTKEQRKNMIQKHQRPCCLVNIKSGFICEFNSIKEAANVIGAYDGTLCDLLKGHRKTCKGYKAFYLPKESVA